MQLAGGAAVLALALALIAKVACNVGIAEDHQATGRLVNLRHWNDQYE